MTQTISKFKNVNGVWLTREIFFETAQNKANVIYTLKQEEHLGYPSLYLKYLEEGDITEYTFAVNHLGGWAHWKILSETSFFRPYLTDWREELEVKLRSQALAKIINTAAGTTKDAFAAQKFVSHREWDKAAGPTKGRPSNRQIKQAANDIAADNARLNEDLQRLMN